MGGSWNENEKKVRAGFYMRFVSKAIEAIKGGSRGIVAIPIKANWGPAKQIVEITSEKELIDNYGTDVAGNFTAYNALRLCMLGKPQKILGYRMVDGTEVAPFVTLADTTGVPVNVLKLESLYPTTRDFKVTARDNAVDPANKKDIVLYEGATQLLVFTFDKGDIDNAVAAINDDADNRWIKVTKLADGNNTLADITDQPMTGGNAGVAAITSAHYTEAMTAFEARQFNAFTLDGLSDGAIQTSVKAWVDRLRGEGKKIVAFVGGASADDQNITNANIRSTGFNFEGVVNVGVGVELDGVQYSSAYHACYVAGKASGQQLKESLTYAATPFDDVIPRLTDSEIKSAILAGTLVAFHNGSQVIYDKAINTLTTLGADQGSVWKKIKGVRIMDAIETDGNELAQSSYIGKIINNKDGQIGFLSGLKRYFETLSPTLIADDFTVEEDTDKTANALADEFYWRYDAKLIDSMENIYGTGYIR